MAGRKVIAIGIILALGAITPIRILAGPVSEHYELSQFGFGSGGTATASSESYSINAVLGEQSVSSASSDTYNLNAGLAATVKVSTPGTPALTNPGSTYDRLKLIIDPGRNTPDISFTVAISDDNWTTTQYVQDDFTPGAVLGNEDWLTYAQWGETVGIYITGLKQNTTYTVKVKARQGDFTESSWSRDDNAVTQSPTLTFSLSTDRITFDTLSGENSWTDSTKNTVITTSTNAYHGYTVYGHETGPLTNSQNTPLPDFAPPNSDPAAWSGTGFGYTTSDTDLAGGTADRFSGSKYAGFTTAAPGDPVADHTANVVENPIVNEAHTVTYRVTASEIQAAGSYATSIVYVVVPEY